MRTATALSAVLVLGVLPFGCKQDRPPENPPMMAPSASAAVYPTATTAPSVAPVAASPATTPPPAASAPPAATAVFDAAAQELIRTQIKALAPKHAPGMKVEGSLVGGSLAEGQTVEQQASLIPNKCYTVIGTGMPAIQELDVKISVLTPLPTVSPILAVDNMTGAMAIVGDHPNCYKAISPLGLGIPVKISVTATRGTGMAGAQMYMK